MNRNSVANHRKFNSLLLMLLILFCGAPCIAAEPSPPVTGTLKGRFVHLGSLPAPKLLQVPASFAAYNLVDESLLVNHIWGIQNVFIWVRSKDVPEPPQLNLLPITLEFKQGRLTPHAQAFQVSRKLVFQNDDAAALCNIKPMFITNTAINLLLPPNQQNIVRITKPEPIPARVDSKLQPWLCAWILPLSHPYFAVSDEGGDFSIENLPPGKWEFQVWHERTGFLQTREWPHGRFTMEIKPGINNLGTVKLPPALFNK